jgi:hypothetical protein
MALLWEIIHLEYIKERAYSSFLAEAPISCQNKEQPQAPPDAEPVKLQGQGE